jgi:antitoxin component of MazEF toxin-antitoxin module
MTPTYKIRAIGGGLVVTIPRHIIKLIPVKAGDEVVFTIAQNGRRDSRGLIIMEPQPGPKRGRK